MPIEVKQMERAMGYVTEFEDRAQEYKVKADEGMCIKLIMNLHDMHGEYNDTFL